MITQEGKQVVRKEVNPEIVKLGLIHEKPTTENIVDVNHHSLNSEEVNPKFIAVMGDTSQIWTQ